MSVPTSLLRAFLASLATCVVLVAAPAASAATTFTVNVSTDQNDLDFGGTFDGSCDVDAGTALEQCTLRAAIQEVNAGNAPGPWTIHFTSDVELNASPPAIGEPVTIDGCNGVPSLEPCASIDQAFTASALRISGSNVIVRNLAFPGSEGASNGVWLEAGINHRIVGNWFGVDDAGVPGSIGNGVLVGNGVSDTTIGGTASADRNVFTGGSAGVFLDGAFETTIIGNDFGVNPDGTVPTTPVFDAIAVGNDVQHLDIGGELSVPEMVSADCDGPCNRIGAATTGIDLVAPGDQNAQPRYVTIHGNYIGTSADGTSAIGAAAAGVTAIDAGTTMELSIGDGTASRRNVIGGPWTNGIVESGASNYLLVLGNHLGVNAAGTAAIPMEQSPPSSSRAARATPPRSTTTSSPAIRRVASQ